MNRQELKKKIEDYTNKYKKPNYYAYDGEIEQTQQAILSAVDEYVAWVIGSGDPTIRQYYGDRVNVDMQVSEMFRNEMSGRHSLKREQRQRAGLGE